MAKKKRTTMAKQKIEFERLWDKARRAAQIAADKQNAKLGDQDDSGFRPVAILGPRGSLCPGRWPSGAGQRKANDDGQGAS
jgi:hypothetical protein